MGKPTFNDINVAIQNADLTYFQINRLIRALERKRANAPVEIEPVEYNPPTTAISTIEQSTTYIEHLEKTVDTYQANTDALMRIFSKGERLNVIRKPNGKLEPYYSSSQWTALTNTVWQKAQTFVVDYAMNYLFPYSQAAYELEKVTQEIMDNVFKLNTSGLAAVLPGAAGELEKCLTNLIERRQMAYLTNDIGFIIDDVNANCTLLVEFNTKPTKENHEALKKKFDNWKTVPVQRLLNFRDNLPKVGRRPGADDKRVIIWQHAEPYYTQFGAEYAGEKAIEALEKFFADTEKRLELEEAKQIFPIQWAALDTLKYTIRDGIRCERKRIPAGENGSLARYVNGLAHDAKIGKLKIAFEK